MTIRIPDGNAFRIRLTARNLITGEYTEAADLSNIDNLVINYVRRGIRFPHAYTIDEEGRATVADAGTLDCGFYGIELTGYYGGEKFRFYGKDLFEITTDTTDVIDPSNLIDIEITVKLNASGVSKDYVDHAINGMEASMETMQADLRDEIAEAGKVDDVKVNGVSVVSGKKANITVPNKVSDLTNDSEFQTQQQVAVAVAAVAINEVSVEYEEDGGEPDADATLNNGELALSLKNMKMKFSDLTAEEKEALKGPKGDQGDSAVFDPATGNILATLHNTTGYDDTSAMTQKAVTEELDKFVAEVLPTLVWYNGTITTSGYGTSTTERYLEAITFGSDIAKVVIKPQTNQAKFYLYSISNVGGTDVYAKESGENAIMYPNSFSFVPEPGKRYVVRMAKDTVARGSWTQEAKPVITKYYESLTHQIDENKADIENIKEAVTRETYWPNYRYGQISTSGYDWTAKTNKLSPEMEFDTEKVKQVRVFLPISGASYTIYTIVGNTIVMLDGMTGYTSSETVITPVSGTKYVIRFRAASEATQEAMDALDPSCYPMVTVSYNNPAEVLEKIKERVTALEGKAYGYSRKYNNITPLLNFEQKAISTEGIEDSQVALLAKIPSAGCVEVKMNKPVGGFSVWKKTGNNITCLQAYTHYQFRYTGDYDSEYFVMLQAETGETLSTAIASVYTYSDEGMAYAHAVNAPAWAAGKRIAFLGDSIVQGRYPKNGAESVNLCMDKPWPNLVAEALGTEDYTDFAIGGATVYDSDWKSLQRNAGLIAGYDVVFVCGGTNDYGGKVSKANFEAAYADMLDTLIANNTRVIAMTPVYRTKAVSNPVMALSGYADSINDIATSKGVDVIQMLAISNKNDFEANLVDGLHPNEIGQRMIADTVLEEIKKI